MSAAASPLMTWMGFLLTSIFPVVAWLSFQRHLQWFLKLRGGISGSDLLSAVGKQRVQSLLF